MLSDHASLFQLEVSERIELVGALWDSIAKEPSALTIPAWQKEELSRRDAEYQRNPGIAVSWEEAKLQIRGQRHA